MALRIVLLGLALLTAPSRGLAGGRDGEDARRWAFDLSLTWFFLPDEADYLQPTVEIDRGALHVEGRYAYEDRETVSAFVGRSFVLGEAPKLSLTPMVGVAVGRTDAVVPALELALTWGRVELRSASEWVLAPGGSSGGFFYSWSEATVRVGRGLDVGAVAQRTRFFREPRDVSVGPMVTFSAGPLQASVYLFEPWDAKRFAAVSVGFGM